MQEPTIKITQELKERLRKRQHPGQSWAGVIQELLDEVDHTAGILRSQDTKNSTLQENKIK